MSVSPLEQSVKYMFTGKLKLVSGRFKPACNCFAPDSFYN